MKDLRRRGQETSLESRRAWLGKNDGGTAATHQPDTNLFYCKNPKASLAGETTKRNKHKSTIGDRQLRPPPLQAHFHFLVRMSSDQFLQNNSRSPNQVQDHFQDAQTNRHERRKAVSNDQRTTQGPRVVAIGPLLGSYRRYGKKRKCLWKS